MFYRIFVVCSNASPEFQCTMCRSIINSRILRGKVNSGKEYRLFTIKLLFVSMNLYAYAKTVT